MSDIPFYTDIYAFPGPHGHLHHHHEPHFKKTQVIETSKEVAINDAFGNTRYVVQLVSKRLKDCLGFQVRVIHLYPNATENDNDLILVIPEHGYELDYKKIEKEFDTCVQRYNSLVKAEVQDFRDVDIYKDKIGYKETHPDCCMFCKWCRKSDRFDRWNYCHIYPKLECHNPENEVKFTYMVDDDCFPNKNHHRYCQDGWRKLPWMEEDPFKRIPLRGDEILNRIFPHVDPFGICDGFARRIDPDTPPNQN